MFSENNNKWTKKPKYFDAHFAIDMMQNQQLNRKNTIEVLLLPTLEWPKEIEKHNEKTRYN